MPETSKADGHERDETDILLDVRCLQDDGFRPRGVGRLSVSLIEQARAVLPAPDRKRLIALADPRMRPLDVGDRALFDDIRTSAYTGMLRRPTWFVSLSPMTHDPLFTARLLHHPCVLKTAVVYDFIPLDEPARYLPTPAARMAYHVSLYWLARHDLHAPISVATADRLRTLLRVPACDLSVIGAPVHPMFEAPRQAAQPGAVPPHILVIGGGDARKNVEVAIRAHAGSRALQAAGIRLTITGQYGAADLAAFEALRAGSGGDGRLLHFPGHVSEAALLDLYAGALCVVSPSRAEGFSLPVVEAMAAGAPVIVSDIAAHRELVTHAELRFGLDDAPGLARLLERAVADVDFRAGIVASQSGVWPRFRGRAVAERFWKPIAARAERMGGSLAAPSIRLGRRPRVALLAPLPPARSGVADYTAASLPEIGRLVDLHVFTPTPDPLPAPGALSVRPFSALPQLSSGFDRVVGVMGNSHFHTEIFEHLLRYGGACINHDNRLLGFYRILLGEQRCREQAERELGRALRTGELETWLSDEATLPITFLGELAASAEPMFVHSRVTGRLIAETLGARPVHLPFCIYRNQRPTGLTRDARRAPRARLGIAEDEIAIATFGAIDRSKAPEDCIWALEMLHSWGHRAKLYFVGESTGDVAPLRALARSIGVGDQVVFTDGHIGEALYNDYLAAADIAIQLRTHKLGGLSGAMLDCLAVGMPTIANEDLAEAMEAPCYVHRVPDHPSPVLIAEALAGVIESGVQRPSWEVARQAYQQAHEFSVYAARLMEALELEAARPTVVQTRPAMALVPA